METDVFAYDNIWGNPTENSSIIKVIGVGGGGCNAVDHMYKQGIKDVGFVVCNTDAQALNNSPVPIKVQLGKRITEGLGAGSDPERGRLAAEESIAEISEMLRNNTKMVFVTAGMGGGTGTGATPVIAKTAKDMGILTVAIVTIPFASIESRRVEIAYEGIKELRKYVDSLLVVNNNKLEELFGDCGLFESFAKADDVLCTAAKGIAEIITTSGHINVDFADVRAAMLNSGVALMGTGRGTGTDRASVAVEQAITSPLLNNNSIRGARNVLVNVLMGSNELTLKEFAGITQRIIEETGSDLNVKTGVGFSAALADDEVTVSIIATGFEMGDIDIPGTDKVVAKVNNGSADKGKDDEITFINDREIAKKPLATQPIATSAGTTGVSSGFKPATSGKPRLLDETIPIEEKERVHPRKVVSQKEEQVSLFSLNKDGGIENSTASYINGKPD